MHRSLLAVTAFVLGIGIMAIRASESAALPDQMEAPSPTLAAFAAGTAAAELAPSAYSEESAANDDTNGYADAGLDSQIAAWVRTLSAQDEFRVWQDARWTRYPLGPGMHGWLILLHKDGREIGYLVVGSTEDGKLKLVEYGAGDSPLFSLNTLYRSLIQLELILPEPLPLDHGQAHAASALYERLYYSPLHAVWKVPGGDEPLYIDAKTGEWLPLSERSFLPLQPLDPADPHSALPNPLPPQQRSSRLPPFDPFDNTYWIQDKPLVVTTVQELIAAIGQSKPPVTFTANLYGNSVLVPLAVTGFHDWGDDSGGISLIRLEQEGGRYVPYGVLAQYGAFHQQRPDASS